MRINASGLALIKVFEGLRLKAYRCSAGVLTIGYGHTSAAGKPLVKPGMAIGKAEAEAIFASDISMFASKVQAMLRNADLTDNQFSALVSFAYNVGLGAFGKSSVLKAVNQRDFAAVPRRLSLWVKAKGQVLPGLVKRRAAEGLLFQKNPANMSLFNATMPQPSDYEIEAMDEARGLLDVPMGTAMTGSTTIWAAVVGGVSTLSNLALSLKEDVSKAIWSVQEWYFVVPQEHWATLMLSAAAVGGLLWIVRERWKKARDDGL